MFILILLEVNGFRINLNYFLGLYLTWELLWYGFVQNVIV